jgi:hypothetical protein
LVPANTGIQKPNAVSPAAQPSRWLRIGFWICIVISVAVVLRRVVALARPSRSAPPQLAQLDAAFASHTALTLAHIVPASAFVLLIPFVYIRRFAGAAWPKHLLFPLGLVVGVTPFAMSKYSIGGWVERSAVLFFNSLFLFSLFRAWSLRRDPVLSLRWITRAIAILRGIATTRPVMGIFFATSRVTHLSPNRYRLLDRLLNQHPDHRIMASITGREVPNRKNGNGSLVSFGP